MRVSILLMQNKLNGKMSASSPPPHKNDAPKGRIS
jgi:hypothetical protein